MRPHILLARIERTTVWWRSQVNHIDGRVAYLEGRVEEQTTMVYGLRDAITGLEDRMDRRFAGLDQRLDNLDAKMSRQFIWLVGLIVSLLIAVVAGMGGMIAAIIQT